MCVPVASRILGDPGDETMNAELKKYGALGFELVAAVPVSDGSVGTKRIVLFFKRPMPDTSES